MKVLVGGFGQYVVRIGKLLLVVLFLLFLPFFITPMEVSCFSPCILVLAREGNTLEALVQLSAVASSQFLLYA